LEETIDEPLGGSTTSRIINIVIFEKLRTLHRKGSLSSLLTRLSSRRQNTTREEDSIRYYCRIRYEVWTGEKGISCDKKENKNDESRFGSAGLPALVGSLTDRL